MSFAFSNSFRWRETIALLIFSSKAISLAVDGLLANMVNIWILVLEASALYTSMPSCSRFKTISDSSPTFKIVYIHSDFMDIEYFINNSILKGFLGYLVCVGGGCASVPTLKSRSTISVHRASSRFT